MSEEQRPQRLQQLKRMRLGATTHQRGGKLPGGAVAAIDHVGQVAHLQRRGDAMPAAAGKPRRPSGRAQQDQARIEIRRRIACIGRSRQR
ncbi:MAG: hypothetical protein ACSLFJ_13525 [Immundisolibacter sp.]|uniref:hypothetical protein n=1 Tax=Immundisolibacter sp. TaxID=1934948 RepID=UPI003EE39017